MRLDDYAALGGHVDAVRRAEDLAGRGPPAGDRLAAGQPVAVRARALPVEPRRLSALRRPRPQAAMLPDGRRLHLQHGPIDLIIEAFGAADAVRSGLRAGDRPLRDRSWTNWSPSCRCCARRSAASRPRSRARWRGAWSPPARRTRACSSRRWRRSPAPSPTRCWRRCWPATRLRRAYVNDGGDIALHLAPGERFDVGLVADARPPGDRRHDDDRGGDAGARHRHQRPGRPQLLARHRRCGHRARRRRRRGRRRGDADRQRRRHRQPAGRAPAGARRCRRTAISATCRWWLRSARSPRMMSTPRWTRDWRRRSGCGRRG